MKSSFLKIFLALIVAIFLNVSADAQTLDDKTRVIQLALDLPELQTYFNVKEKPERAQVYILDNGKILKTLPLQKFGNKVIIGGTSQIPANSAFIEFVKADFKAAFAELEFNYPAEKIKVTAKFAKKGNKWTKVSSNITELR